MLSRNNHVQEYSNHVARDTFQNLALDAQWKSGPKDNSSRVAFRTQANTQSYSGLPQERFTTILNDF